MDLYQLEIAENRWAPPPAPASAWDRPPAAVATHRYAGFWRRYLAALIDCILFTNAVSILGHVFGRLTGADASGEAGTWLMTNFGVLIVCDWLYFAGMESSAWRATLGKRILGIVVTDLAGDRISFGRATGRYFASYLSYVILFMGYLMQPFTAKRQALHDKIAGTLVVRS